jgi:hypothetical protein
LKSVTNGSRHASGSKVTRRGGDRVRICLQRHIVFQESCQLSHTDVFYGPQLLIGI